jgi:GTPase
MKTSFPLNTTSAHSGNCHIGNQDEFARTLQDVELLITYYAGARLAELHAIARDLERVETPEGVRVVARLPVAVAARYQPFALSHPLA